MIISKVSWVGYLMGTIAHFLAEEAEEVMPRDYGQGLGMSK